MSLFKKEKVQEDRNENLYQGIDFDKIVRGFAFAAQEDLRELKAYIEMRKKKESVKFAPLYIDILHEINKYLREA